MTPGPSGALAAAPLSHDRVAVLAGSDDAKGVFVIDLDSGRIKQSFGVTRESTGISTETPDGPVLVSVSGHTGDGHAVGSVEVWSLAGEKQQVVPMPSPALALTQAVDGNLYVLVGDDRARAALPLSLPSLQAGSALQLDGGTAYVALCRVGGTVFLVYSADGGVISARTMDNGQVVRSTVGGESPNCIDGVPRIYAISKSFTTRSLVVLSLPDMSQVSSIPASNDVRAIYPSDDHALLGLNATSQVSNIQRFASDKLGIASSTQVR
jgi:hypothetical protein